MINSFEVLVSHKLRATEERLALLDILANANKPLKIVEILRIDRKGIMNQATVYRTLDTFTKSGIVKEINLGRGSVYYELVDPRDHHHLVCTDCGRVEDFLGCDFTSLARKALAKSKQFRLIKDHSLEMFGLCNSCSK